MGAIRVASAADKQVVNGACPMAESRIKIFGGWGWMPRYPHGLQMDVIVFRAKNCRGKRGELQADMATDASVKEPDKWKRFGV